MLGIVRLGAVPVPSTLLLTARDLAYRIEVAEVTAVITDVEGTAKLAEFAGKRFLVGGDQSGWASFDAGLRSASPAYQGEPTRSDDPGIIYFTSATTGEPKMVLHTQASYGLAHRLTGQLWLDLSPNDLHWNLSDVGWGKAAWSSFYGPWHMGACVFALEAQGRFDPVLSLRTLTRYPITTWCAPPTALRLIIRENLADYHFPHLRHCVSAGEPVNPEVIAAWKAATGLTIYEAYGQTETVVLIGNYRSLGHEIRPGSMGKATPDFEVAVLDEHLNELPPGQEGEIAVRTAPKRPVGLFREYWHNPAQNAAQFREGWYLTGDRALCDTDGYFWFIGRQDDVIKSSGYRIGPCEVENALLEHEAVLDVAVVGKPDAVRGQIVKAFVILRNQFTATETLRHELQQHCKRIVAPYKYPREIEFVTELPKTTSGKTRRVELRQRG
jgi:acetyl-CoA synthetase/medium-chain acyl-CoA synthetase